MYHVAPDACFIIDTVHFAVSIDIAHSALWLSSTANISLSVALDAAVIQTNVYCLLTLCVVLCGVLCCKGTKL